MKSDQTEKTVHLPEAPVAPASPKDFTYHGITVHDPFAGLKDDDYPTVNDEETLAYLTAENAYFEAAMAPVEGLTETIFEEFKGRIKEDDSSVPDRDGNFLYHWRYEPGAQYRQWLRQPVAGGSAAVILDEVQRAEGHEFYNMGAITISPDEKYLAWSEDLDGSERYRIFVKDIASGEIIDQAVSNSVGYAVWAADSKSFFYSVLSEEWRPFKVMRHELSGDAADDNLIYEEADTSFFVGLGKTQSRAYIIILVGDNVTTEIRLIPTDRPEAEPVLVAARKANHEYYLDHAGDHFFIRTNDTHKNFRVAVAPESAPGQDSWQELISASDTNYIRSLTSFEDFLALEERISGLDQIRVRYHDGDEHFIEFPEAAYTARISNNPEYAVDSLRLHYESMVTPDTVFDYPLAKRQLVTRKVQEIPSGYEASNYATERLWAAARDGAKVPISIVYHKDFPKDGSGRLHIYGYGAYGSGRPINFSSLRLSLLDRGFAYAIAHIRGGDEMGYHWYEDGKLFKRTNTFHDFVDVAKHLIEEDYVTAGNISISGGSAGGSLMGYVANSNPELWRAVVAHVPFVDILNTMLDDSLPLTPIEWPEWGNPITDKAVFEYILSYSPYDNVSPQDYAPMMVTAGLNDPRVTYWEPAKWVARLRTVKTDDNLLVLKTNMGAGHRGLTGRYKELFEIAEEYAFILMSFGLIDPNAGTP
jgi:oligopeptidase B